MKLLEFIEKYGEDLLDHYMPKRLFIKELGSLGWEMGKIVMLKELDKEADNSIVCTNPNFYPNGIIMGISTKTKIQACCETLFFIEDRSYNNIAEAVQLEGPEILYSINEWDWRITKEWVISRLATDKFITTFETFEECPTRKSIRG